MPLPTTPHLGKKEANVEDSTPPLKGEGLTITTLIRPRKRIVDTPSDEDEELEGRFDVKLN